MNDTEDQEEVPLLPMIMGHEPEEDEGETDSKQEEYINLEHEDEEVNNDIIQDNVVDKLDNEEQITVNELNKKVDHVRSGSSYRANTTDRESKSYLSNSDDRSGKISSLINQL